MLHEFNLTRVSGAPGHYIIPATQGMYAFHAPNKIYSVPDNRYVTNTKTYNEVFEVISPAWLKAVNRKVYIVDNKYKLSEVEYDGRVFWIIPDTPDYAWDGATQFIQLNISNPMHLQGDELQNARTSLMGWWIELVQKAIIAKIDATIENYSQTPVNKIETRSERMARHMIEGDVGAWDAEEHFDPLDRL